MSKLIWTEKDGAFRAEQNGFIYDIYMIGSSRGRLYLKINGFTLSGHSQSLDRKKDNAQSFANAIAKTIEEAVGHANQTMNTQPSPEPEKSAFEKLRDWREETLTPLMPELVSEKTLEEIWRKQWDFFILHSGVEPEDSRVANSFKVVCKAVASHARKEAQREVQKILDDAPSADYGYCLAVHFITSELAKGTV